MLRNWLVIHFLVFAASLAPVCHAQNASKPDCGHSTVADAWGSKFASQAEMFLARLQRVIRTDDKTKFAALVRYPIRVSWGDQNSEVSTPADFFANGQGVMIGDGQIWFQEQEDGTMKIIKITLDPTEPAR